MTIRAEAEQMLRRQAEEERAHAERETGAAKKIVESWFYGDFYKHHIVRNPDYKPHVYAPQSNPPRIVDPTRPLPPLEAFALTHLDIHADAAFVCDGVSYRVRWEYHPGGDRADWDDGWWPQWYVVVRVPRLLGLLGHREREVRVTGPGNLLATLIEFGAVPEDRPGWAKPHRPTRS